MGKLVVSENVTLDGVVQDPTGDEGSGLGGWFGRVSAADQEVFTKVKFEEALDSAAVLFGRRSYEWFAARWTSRPGEWADRLRSLPKYVVSSTLRDPGWANSTVLAGDVPAEVARLTRAVDGDVVVYASGQLVRTLLTHDLVDEVRLVVYPFVLGAGDRLFGPLDGGRRLRLRDTRPLGDDLAAVTYAVDRPGPNP